MKLITSNSTRLSKFILRCNSKAIWKCCNFGFLWEIIASCINSFRSRWKGFRKWHFPGRTVSRMMLLKMIKASFFYFPRKIMQNYTFWNCKRTYKMFNISSKETRRMGNVQNRDFSRTANIRLKGKQVVLQVNQILSTQNAEH